MQVLEVRVGDELRSAILYPRYAAPAVRGDRVVLNTTAVDLGLGTGGFDFVVWNLSRVSYDSVSGGHVMKLRYTPAQADVLAVEAPESPHHSMLESAASVDGMPVVAASLHSQLLPVVCGLRGRRVAYVMTDGGALEASFSRTATRLRELGWIAGVVTVGHAIGGDIEAVNVYSGLLAARHVLGAEVAVVGMGPGVVGTSTALGTTALDLGLTVNAAASVGGRPVACVRLSGADARDRHSGLSRHASVALMTVALAIADVPVPKGCAELVAELESAHRVVEVDCDGVLDALDEAESHGLAARHMGRKPDEDPLFFQAAGAAGLYASSLVLAG